MSLEPYDLPPLRRLDRPEVDLWFRALRGAEGLVVEIGPDGAWSAGPGAAGLLLGMGLPATATTSRGVLGERAGAQVDDAVADVLETRGVRVVEVEIDEDRALELALVPVGERAVAAWLRDASGRRRGQRRIVALVRAQEIARRLSSALLDPQTFEVDTAVDAALAELGALASADRAYVFLARGARMDNSHEWCAPGVAPQKDNLQDLPVGEFRFFMEPLASGRPLFIPSVADLPDDAGAEREVLAAQGIASLLAVPVAVDRELLGFLGVDNPRIAPLKPDEFSGLMQLLADAIGAGVNRARALAEQKHLALRLADRATWQRRLGALSIRLARCPSVEALAAAVAVDAPQLLEVERVELAVRTPGGSLVRRWTLLDGAARPEVAGELAACEICAQVVREGAPLATTGSFGDPTRDWSRWVEPGSRTQVACVPLDGPEAPVGVLTLVEERDGAWSDEEVSRAAQLSALLGAHLAAAQAREDVASLNASLEARVDARTRSLQESEHRFKAVFEHAPYAVLQVDGDGRVIEANVRAKRLFERGGDALRDGGLDDLFTAAHAASLLDAVRAVAAEGPGPTSRPRQVEALRAEGASFDAEVLLSCLPGPEGAQVLVAVHDVSHRRRSDEALARATAEKEGVHREVQRRVGQDLDMVHGLLGLVADQMPVPRARSIVQETMQRVRAMGIVHELLAAVAADGAVDLALLAHRLVDGLRVATRTEARIDVRTAVAPLGVDVAMGMGLILTELLSNALRYGARRANLDAGEPTVGGDRDWDVLVEVGAEDGAVWIVVTDRGPGLAPGFTIDAAGSIGLQLVRSLARKIGASVHHESVPGARFRVRWQPAGGEQAAERPPTLEVQLIESGLIVESVPLGTDPVVIGRAPGSRLVAVEPTVSGRHAVVWREGGQVWIEDLGSRNQTFVNGAALTGAARVRPGDRIGLGHRAGLRVHAPGTVAGPPIGFVVEDVASGVRHLASTDRVRIGGGLDDDLLVPGAPAGEAVLLLSPCGSIGLGRPPTSERPLRFGEVFAVADRRFRVFGVAPTSTSTASTEPTTYPYGVRLSAGAGGGVAAVLLHLEIGSMQPIRGRANAAVMAALARRWASDRAARMPFAMRGWLTEDELVEALALAGETLGDRRPGDLIADLRAVARRGGFEPWFIDIRGTAARIRVRQVIDAAS
jgi:PAS domain S-box-containing protein